MTFDQGWMAVISATEPMRCAKATTCLNRLELLVDPGMDSETIGKWAHAAVDNWLSTRVDLTSASVYDADTLKGQAHG